MADDYSPGLEGVIAFETEIAEPDKDGGSLRYRGIDIEDLVGRYPFENVWGLLVDEDINSPLPFPEPIELQDPSGAVPADLQAGLASLGPKWGLQKLVEPVADFLVPALAPALVSAPLLPFWPLMARDIRWF